MSDDNNARYAVYHHEYLWLVDTCAGGTWSTQVSEAAWFSSEREASDAIRAAGIARIEATFPGAIVVICRVR